MQVLEGLDGLRRLAPGSVMSIGNFDGLHLGHRHILDTAKRLRLSLPSARIALVTFEPHPLTVLRPAAAPPRLSPLTLKRRLLETAGVDDLIILPPGRQVLDLTAEQFWAILRDEARPAHLIEGPDFSFGKDRGGTIERLRGWCAGTAVQLHVIDPVRVPLLDLQVVPVSSSLIRWLIRHGRVRDAAICLGKPYTLQGHVIEGHRRGRTIGVPTANVDIVDQLLPADGVYAGRCEVDGQTYAAAVSIGVAPTFGDSRRQIEAHLINFTGDLYGRTLQLELIDWTRDQIRFRGVDALKAQLARDIAVADSLRNRTPQLPIASAS
jgi:riboflavin kinase/FMN adenylyltransferase